MSIRTRILFYLFLLAFLGLAGRLFYWQIYRGKDLSIQAKDQYQLGHSLVASRGEILANDKTWLAATSGAWLVFAHIPEFEKDPRFIAEKLAPIFIEEGVVDESGKLLEEIDRIVSLLTKEGAVWVPLKQKVSANAKAQIEDLGFKGIGFEVQEKRSYPEASSAAQLLGFVGKDAQGVDKGYFGLEGQYDLVLSGKPGFLSRETDARGIPILISASREVSAVGGVNLVTNIDKTIQINLEQKLLEGIRKYGAISGTAIIADPKNGAILGMSSYPSFDPQKYWEFSDEYFKNPAISTAFEPGSIFKVLVMAGALDSGAVKPDTRCEICNGPVVVDKYVIETWNQVYHPDSTMQDVIVNSDNVGMVYVGQKLGAEKLYDYLSAFGIGEKTNIDLQGEVNPGLRSKDSWGIVELATASFGQGVAVTPIQMVRAVSAIANGGILTTPQVVDRIEKDGWEEDIKPVFSERIISQETAFKVTAMMVEAARKGESKWTHLQGFKVAGKTGTAQIPIEGHYDEDKTIASFIGFAPYDDPKFIMLVTLQEPTSSPWASETAAPLWYSIAKDLFLYLGIQPEN